MTKTRQHFDFGSVHFEMGIAHDGEAPIHFRRVRDHDDGFAGNFLDYVSMPPNSDIGFHSHTTDNEEIYVIISGQGHMRLDTEAFDVGPGHVIVNRPGGSHALRNVGSVELRLIVVEIPAAQDAAPPKRAPL